LAQDLLALIHAHQQRYPARDRFSELEGAMASFFEAADAVEQQLRDEEKKLAELRVKLHADLEDRLGIPTASQKKAKASDILQFNVGGDSKFATRRDTLTALPASRLAEVFSGQWDAAMTRDSENRIFLDIDPLQFRALLAWLVDVKRVGPGVALPALPTSTLPSEHQWGFEALCGFLGLSLELGGDVAKQKSEASPPPEKTLAEQPGMANLDSSVMSADATLKLGQLLGDDFEHAAVTLLYRASRDGFAAPVFHQRCDNQGPTLVIARSAGGYVFGGYTDIAWDSSGAYRQSQKAFLFRLAGPDGVAASKHTLFQNHQNSIYCCANYQATFGGGHDMLIQPSGPTAQAVFKIGNTYNSAGSAGTSTFLAEAQTVTVTDCEVFSL